MGHSEEVPYVTMIVQTRYGGSYEGGAWAALRCHPLHAPDDMDGDDPVCCAWWEANAGYVGVGDTPNDALADLAAKGYPILPELVDKEW